MRYPPPRHKRIRTTNLIERTFEEQRRRFWDEKSCLKLSFATLMQASERWQNVGMGEVEVALLKQLRRELGVQATPSPASNAKVS